MTDGEELCWREAVRVCLETSDVGRLAEHVAGLPEERRRMLLEAIGSDGLRSHVRSLLARRREQLALV